MLIALGAISFSCNNDSSSDNDKNGDGFTAGTIDGDDDRVDNSNNGDPVTQNAAFDRLRKKSPSVKEESSVIIPPLTLPLFYNGKIRANGLGDGTDSQQANDVVYDGSQFAYIAYGTMDASNIGDTDASGAISYHGYIDVIDLSNPEEPSIVQTVDLNNIDLFGLSLNEDNSKLYATGAVNKDVWNASEDHKDNQVSSSAVLLSFNTSELNISTPSIDYTLNDVPGYVAKDVIAKGGKVYVISGTDGYSVEFNAEDMTIENSTSVGDGRSININNNGKGYWLTGTDLNSFTGTSATVTMDDKAGAQRLMGFYQGIYPIVSLGKNGIAMYNEDLSEIGTIANVKNNYSSSDTDEEANDVASYQDKFVLIAEGANGVMIHWVGDLIADPDLSYQKCNGGIVLEGSPNKIFTSGDYLFIASGTAGMTIIKYVEQPIDSDVPSELSPSYEISYDSSSENQSISGGNYTGYLSSGLNYTFKASNDVDWYGSMIFSSPLVLEGSSYLYVSNIFQSTDITIGDDATLKLAGDVAIKGDIKASEYGDDDTNDNIVLPAGSVVDGSIGLYSAEGTIQGDIAGGLYLAVYDGKEQGSEAKLGNTTFGKASTIGENCTLTVNGSDVTITINGDLTIKPHAKINIDSSFTNCKIVVNGNLISGGNWEVNATKGQGFKIQAKFLDGVSGITTGADTEWSDIFETI